MTVSNVGPDTARELVIASSVDADQKIGAMMCTASAGGTCPSTLGASMTVASLPKDGVLTFTMPTSVPAGGSGRISATVAVQLAGDPQTANNSSTASAKTTPPNSIRLQSDAGDYIGIGRTYSYLRTNSVLTVEATGRHLSARVSGDEWWFGDLELPNSLSQFQAGTFINLMRYPFHDPAAGGLSWSGEGRGCNTLRGSFAVTNAGYVNGVLDEIDVEFAQHCEGGTPALRGQIHWTSSDMSEPPGPANPPPATLWEPPAAVIPATGNYAYLQSDSGDYIGLGGTYLYTQSNSTLTVTSAGSRLMVSVAGKEIWSATFQAMNGVGFLQPGYYGDVRRYPFHNPAKGGLDWSGEGRGCNELRGWFVVDSISFDSGALKAVEMRFQQHCEGGAPALRGKLRWAQ